MFIQELFEDNGKTVVLVYGRFNPPTIGHQKLIDFTLSIPGDHAIVVSHTEDNKTNPLTQSEKLTYLKKMYPTMNVFVRATSEMPTIVNVASKLCEKGYTNLVIVAGSDRVTSFEKLFNDYNGKPDKSGKVLYRFNSIKVVSAGERDPDADGAEGMSASKMREAAIAGNEEAFKSGLAPALQPYAQKMMQQISSRIKPAKVKKVAEGYKPVSNAKNYVRKGGNGDHFAWLVKRRDGKTKKVWAADREGVNDWIDAHDKILGYTATRIKEGVNEGEVIPFKPKQEKKYYCKQCGGELVGGKDELGRVKVCVPCLKIYRLEESITQLKETLVRGFGNMYPAQVHQEIEKLIDDMRQYAAQGNMAAVEEYVRKLQPFLQAAKQTVNPRA